MEGKCVSTVKGEVPVKNEELNAKAETKDVLISDFKEEKIEEVESSWEFIQRANPPHQKEDMAKVQRTKAGEELNYVEKGTRNEEVITKDGEKVANEEKKECHGESSDKLEEHEETKKEEKSKEILEGKEKGKEEKKKKDKKEEKKKKKPEADEEDEGEKKKKDKKEKKKDKKCSGSGEGTEAEDTENEEKNGIRTMTTRSIRGAAALTRAAAAGGVAAAGVSQHRLLRAALRDLRAGTSSPWLSEVLSGRRWPSIPSASNGAAGARLVSSAAAAAATSPAREEGSRGARFLPGDVVLYQYEACPFCNKVKAFLDYYKIPYKVVEVNPISKKEIKWSDYKKVPILMLDGNPMNDSSAIIDQSFGKIHPDDLAENEEERKWRGWVNNHLVHVLSPNIYRTPSEALESFYYITTHGNFSFMERLIAKYSGAAAMYMVSKKLKKRHNITDERAALYEAAETWVDALKGRPFCGGAEPNLADLAVFGVVRPIRHLQSGKDMVEHTRIGEWYGRMQHAVGNSTRAMTQS